jgi:hypothetical protein
MGANPALWADVQRDLAAARANVAGAVARAASLAAGGAIDDDFRLDREIAVGSMLHNCYSAVERALERLIVAFDGGLPSGRNYHADLIERAAAPLVGVRPAVVSRRLAADLHRLRQFRHAFRNAYGDYDYTRAAENVPIAERAMTLVEIEFANFAAATGMTEDPRGPGEPTSDR